LIDNELKSIKDHESVIELEPKKFGPIIFCLSKITNTKSNVTLGYIFGYKNYNSYLLDKKQWEDWYQKNKCNLGKSIHSADCILPE
jgi:hypothetical protein